MAKVLSFGKLRPGLVEARNFGVLRTILTFVYVWSCLVKLPATAFRNSPPQSWEPVVSLAAAHHLQWGRDIVFTYGPLGFLDTDYYWGNFFWPIVIWAGAFALALTTALVPLLGRVPGAIRLGFFATLPLLTVPASFDLGFDPIHILAITVLGIACLPGERPGALRLVTTGFLFTVLSLIKFTFCIYAVCALFLIAASNRKSCWRNTAILAGSSLLSLLAIYWWTGQSFANIFLHLAGSAQMAAGYSAAMGRPATGLDSVMGVALLILVVGLLFTGWLGSSNWRGRMDRVAIVAAGIFLAWKEGFTRAEIHVVVFFVYSCFLAALLPALLRIDSAAERKRTESTDVLSAPVANSLFARRALALSAACILLSIAHFALCDRDFTAAAGKGLVRRNKDTLTAFLRPATFKVQLEGHLETMRHDRELPGIQAIAGSNTVGALNLDQDIAVLNGLNYVPHPVFENYAAYTPELQRLNTEFFNSQKAPQYVLWHSGTIDGRFPTLDDGEVFLTILKNYSPVVEEKGMILWKHNTPAENAYTLANERETCGTLDQWIPIPPEPTWLRIDCKQSLVGAMQSLLLRCSDLRLEVRLDFGATQSYRLLPGNARSGFLISPLLRADFQLLQAAFASPDRTAQQTAWPAISSAQPPRIVAVRVHAGNGFAYKHSVRFVTQTIHGVWPVHGESLPSPSNEISRAQ